jgi:hypothetical protein
MSDTEAWKGRYRDAAQEKLPGEQVEAAWLFYRTGGYAGLALAPPRGAYLPPMISVLAFAAAVGLTLALSEGSALVTGLVLLAIGTIPVAFTLLERGGAAVRGVVPLHAGSFLAQTGLITVLIALIPG